MNIKCVHFGLIKNTNMKIVQKLVLNFDWFFKRLAVKRQIRRRKEWDKKIRNSMNVEQRHTFELVEQLSKDYPECILYDKYEKDETIIRRPHLLVTMSNYTVQVNNTSGFNPAKLPKPAYDHLMHIVDKCAHRYRRGLKYETQRNIVTFLEKTRKQHKKVKDANENK